METFSDQLRRAILDSGLTRYVISRETGVAESVLSRFVRGERGLSTESIDPLMEFLGLEIRPRRKARRRGT
jgi:transcriptional regulator with XRE-family HTH domain